MMARDVLHSRRETSELLYSHGELHTRVSTRKEIAQDILNCTKPTSVTLNEDQLSKRFKMISASSLRKGETKKVVAEVTNTPGEYTAANSKFEPSFEGHIGVYLFRINVIEERKVNTLWEAFDLAGGETLDLDVASRFTMRVDVPLTVRQPHPAATVTKYGTVDVLVGLAVDKETDEVIVDEFGGQVIEVKAYSVRPAAEHTTRLPHTIAGGGAADDKSAH